MFAEVWQRKLVFNWLLSIACIYISGSLYLLQWGTEWYLPSFVFHVGVLAIPAGFYWFARAEYLDAKETQHAAN